MFSGLWQVELGQAKKQVDNSDMVKYKRMYDEAQGELDELTGELGLLNEKCALPGIMVLCDTAVLQSGWS